MSPVADKDLFRKSWGCFPTGVTVVTFYEDDGIVHGLTANSVSSVSLDPLLVLVCVDHKARSFPIMSKRDRFVMSILARDQEAASSFFARSDTEGSPPFEFQDTGSGNPYLKGALAYMDCQVYAKHVAGDHTIFIGKVDEIELFGGEPLVFSQGKYTDIVPPGS
ncbi:MAG: flavin reductase family protein [Chloroflexi bacterium]|nr:flavin reductase family protein [Chloroflexota bacterium]MCH8282955.1 flavin reductase family protein [Chloroflexota bacterium]